MGRINRFCLLGIATFLFIALINWTGQEWRDALLNSSVKTLQEYVNKYGIPNAEKLQGSPELNEDWPGIGGTRKTENKVVVLMWTPYYAVSKQLLMSLILSGRKWDPNCCVGDDMIVTLDRDMLPKATMVVFYHYHGSFNSTSLPQRYPGQIWVLFCKESPIYSMNLYPYQNIFNWTMSYRFDSDVWSPYGLTLTLDPPIPPEAEITMPGDVPLSQWIANQSQMLVGVMTNCAANSKRGALVKALQNASLPVDVYGVCGNRTICSRHNTSCDHDMFWRDLGTKYKFYFAAENSLCYDYITEKFWRTLENGMVPVVYGGADYTKVAPPNSFIDVKQFPSPKALADHLIILAEDPVEYSKYFEWRRRYKVITTHGWGGWCTLCSLARQYRTNPYNMQISPYKSHADLGKWWLHREQDSNETACTAPLFSL